MRRVLSLSVFNGVHYAETTGASEPTGEISASALTAPANHTAEMPVMFGVGRDHCLSASLSLFPPHPTVFVTSPDGARIASSTGIDVLLLDDFQLVINDTTHLVRPPRRGENDMRHGRGCSICLISSQLATNKTSRPISHHPRTGYR